MAEALSPSAAGVGPQHRSSCRPLAGVWWAERGRRGSLSVSDLSQPTFSIFPLTIHHQHPCRLQPCHQPHHPPTTLQLLFSTSTEVQSRPTKACSLRIFSAAFILAIEVAAETAGPSPPPPSEPPPPSTISPSPIANAWPSFESGPSRPLDHTLDIPLPTADIAALPGPTRSPDPFPPCPALPSASTLRPGRPRSVFGRV